MPRSNDFLSFLREAEAQGCFTRLSELQKYFVFLFFYDYKSWSTGVPSNQPIPVKKHVKGHFRPVKAIGLGMNRSTKISCEGLGNFDFGSTGEKHLISTFQELY